MGHRETRLPHLGYPVLTSDPPCEGTSRLPCDGTSRNLRKPVTSNLPCDQKSLEMREKEERKKKRKKEEKEGGGGIPRKKKNSPSPPKSHFWVTQRAKNRYIPPPLAFASRLGRPCPNAPCLSVLALFPRPSAETEVPPSPHAPVPTAQKSPRMYPTALLCSAPPRSFQCTSSASSL